MGKDLKGKELGEGITQRKDGRYQARYTDRFGNRKTIYSCNLMELRKEFAKAVANDSNLSNVRKNMTVNDWHTIWMDVYKEKNVRGNTKRTYTFIYKNLIEPYIGNRLLTSLVKSDIQRVIDATYDTGYSRSTQTRAKTIMNDMFQRAIEDDLLLNNPCSGIKVHGECNSERTALTLDDQKTFFEFCKNTFYENLFVVAVNTGLRPGELFALNENDIDFENRVIHVTKTLVYQKYPEDLKKSYHVEPPKTKSSIRNVPMNSVCMDYIKRQMSLRERYFDCENDECIDYLFFTKYRTPMNSNIYTCAIRSIVNRINDTRTDSKKFRMFTGHTFRHTFATRCFENGIDGKTVQAYLGHSTINMTLDLYTHVTDEKSLLDIEKIVSKQSKGKVIYIASKFA